MSYAFERDESPAANVRRIGHEQVTGALHQLAEVEEIGVEEAIHEARKRCKQLRGLVRIAPGLGKEAKRANATFRDAAKELSAIRDAQALLGTFDEMVEASDADPSAQDALHAVRGGLAERAEAAAGQVVGRTDELDRAIELLAWGEARIDRWEVPADGWDALDAGVARTYRRGREALAEVRRAPTAEAFHEWRKGAKYAWYHARLLTPMAPSVLEPLADRFHDLADALGDAHDLAVLGDLLESDRPAFGGNAAVAVAASVVGQHRAELEQRAVSLGARLYAEPPKRYAARLGAYWDLWHELGDELAAGELAALHAATAGVAAG